MEKARHQTWASRSPQPAPTNFDNRRQDDRGVLDINIETLDPLRQDVNNIKFRSLVVGANFC